MPPLRHGWDRHPGTGTGGGVIGAGVGTGTGVGVAPVSRVVMQRLK